MTAILYLEHLTDTDLSLLARVDGASSIGELLAQLREDPDHLEVLLQSPALFAVLFGADERDALLRASPFLVFAVLVNRVAQDLARSSYVAEWVGPGRRVPMFEVTGLREFASEAARRLFLAELLASYTHIASGTFWVQTPRGWRRRRFSELDPLRLLELAEVAPEADRPALYRRLGDLALFLTGVFPDYAGRRFLPPIQRQRLQRALSITEGRSADSPDLFGGIGLLEQLGRQAYQTAWRGTEVPAASRVLGDVVEGFGQARRILNVLTDRYMFPYREQWFPLAEG